MHAGRRNIKMPSYQYTNYYCKDKTVSRPSGLAPKRNLITEYFDGSFVRNNAAMTN